MKRHLQILLIICGLVLPALSQTLTNQYQDPLTPGGFFDKVSDKDGREFTLEQLVIKEIGQTGSQIQSVISATCQSGFFICHFANGSGMTSPTNTFEIAAKNSVCQVLYDVSVFLGYTGTWPSGGYVHILVDDISNYANNPATSGVLGLASSYYAYPINPFSQNPGLIKNQMQKTIQSKTDAWTNVLTPINTGGNNYYHGFMAFNFLNAGINWNPLHTSTATATQFDLYTVILHEVIHALGFASLIGPNGASKLGITNNYYSSYDDHLYTNNLSKLLVSSGCSWQYGLSFNVNPSNIQPACPCPSPQCYPQNSTTCNWACIYVGSNPTNVPVYTPNCFEPPSSLSHFEDLCYPNPPAGNDLYFTMSNANGAGVNKRFPKQEERNVLCDLGYTVAPTYTSTAPSASANYTVAPCAGPNIWGINDGISGGGYIYTTTATNALTIAITGILANDAAAATNATCVETVYNNGTVSITGGTISFVPNNGYSGYILLRYIPIDASGNQGNIAYIFGYVFPAQCTPVSPCDMVQNGDFEQNANCGALGMTPAVAVASCWQAYTMNPDLLVENCNASNATAPCNLGNSTMNSSPTFSSHNQTTNPNNNSVIGIGGYNLGTTHRSESLSNYLGTPLLANQVYSLSFWAYQYSGSKNDPLDISSHPQNQFNLPLVLSFGTSSVPIPPQSTYLGGPVPILTTTLNPLMNTWQYYSYQFTYTPGNGNGVFLYAGLNSLLNYSMLVNSGNSNLVNTYWYYMLLDEVSIKTASFTPNFALPQNTICAAMGYTDLAQYVSIPSGTFSGVGVTTVSAGSGIQYNFNSPATLTNSLYTITYTYTDNIGCQQTTYLQVTISNTVPTSSVVISSTPNTLCGNTCTLAVVSPSAGFSFTWQPSGVNSPTTVVTVTTVSTYSALATMSNGCIMAGTISVPPNVPILTVSQTPMCAGSNGTLYIVTPSTYTSVVWLPGNSTGTNYPINGTPSTYTVSITNSIGCTNTMTYSPTLFPLPTLTLTPSPASVCAGTTSTLGPNGNYSYVSYLAPISVTGTLATVSPTVTTVYSAVAWSQAGCLNTITVQVTALPNPGIGLAKTYSTVCPGTNNTLTATLFGVSSFTWLPMNSTVNPIVVTPTSNTTYTAITSNSFGCSAQSTIAVNMNTLALSLSSNSLCPFQTASITSMGNYTAVVWQPGSISGTILTAPTGTPNTYTAAATYSSGCTMTQTITLPLLDAAEFAFYFTTTPTVGICAGTQATIGLGGTPAATVLAWNPGNFNTPTIVVTPTGPTQYTLVVSTAPGCTYTAFTTLNVKTDCCASGTVIPFSAITQSSTNLTGINIINFPINIPSSNTVNVSGELIMAPGASISVNGVLKLDGAHLYSCGSAMWDGIMLMPGSTFSSEAASYSNLIEDAKTAVTVFAPSGNGFGLWSNPNSYQPAICHISNTIFNKNNIGIYIAHFPLTTSTNYNFKVISTVFTCREFSSAITPTSWPQVGLNNSTDLRFLTSQSSTVLSSPYIMNGYSVATKKSPFSTVSSSVGINIGMVGTTTSGSIYPITVGEPTSDYFNIFDSHAFGINAENSHLNSFNNVFQNTYASGGWTKSAASGGMGIRHVNTYYSANRNIVWFTNAKLDLVSSSCPIACNNKFYDCHTGVYIAGTATVNIRHALFSSAQSTANSSGPTARGHQGIAIQSNKFHDYQIHTNKFLNVNTGIKAEMKFDYVTLTPQTATYGEAWGTFSCTANYFSAASANGAAVGSGYMAKGIYIGVPIGSQTITAASFHALGTVNGIKITYNNFDRVRTGVEMLGLLSLGYQKAVSNNAISLTAETNTNNAQYGIKAAYNSKSIVNTNTVVGNATLKNINLNVAGILHQENSPKADVRYNNVSAMARGFEFKDKNPLAVWRCNAMSDCNRGMQASNWGTSTLAVGIGTQGSIAQRCGNTWTAISLPNQQTYVDASSNAVNSPLWVSNSGPEALVQSLQGGFQSTSYWLSSNSSTTNASSNCASPWSGGGCLYCFIGEGGEEEYDVDAEIADLLLFPMLNVDSIIALNNDTLMQWYDGLEEEVGQLFEIEGSLAKGDFETAQDLINGYTPETNVQSNFKDYFQIYHNYAIDDTMSTSDSTDLFVLASQCPGRDGPAIHKARALYNMAYNTILAFNDDSCERIGYSERHMNNGEVRPKSELNQLLTHETGQIKGKIKLRQNLTIYPNPAQEILYIRGGKKDEWLEIRIADAWGRVLKEEKYQANGSRAIDLNLMNGIYFVHITNAKGEKRINKLIISK